MAAAYARFGERNRVPSSSSGFKSDGTTQPSTPNTDLGSAVSAGSALAALVRGMSHGPQPIVGTHSHSTPRRTSGQGRFESPPPLPLPMSAMMGERRSSDSELYDVYDKNKDGAEKDPSLGNDADDDDDDDDGLYAYETNPWSDVSSPTKETMYARTKSMGTPSKQPAPPSPPPPPPTAPPPPLPTAPFSFLPTFSLF